jgi:hypothetical protein
MAGAAEAPRAAGDPSAPRIATRKTVQLDRAQRTDGSFQTIDRVSAIQDHRLTFRLVLRSTGPDRFRSFREPVAIAGDRQPIRRSHLERLDHVRSAEPWAAPRSTAEWLSVKPPERAPLP